MSFLFVIKLTQYDEHKSIRFKSSKNAKSPYLHRQSDQTNKYHEKQITKSYNTHLSQHMEIVQIG